MSKKAHDCRLSPHRSMGSGADWRGGLRGRGSVAPSAAPAAVVRATGGRPPAGGPRGTTGPSTAARRARAIIRRMEPIRFEDVEIVRSRRRTLALQVAGSGRVVARAPLRMPKRDIERFFEEKRPWVERALAKASERAEARARAAADGRLSDADIRELAGRARVAVPARLEHFAPLIGVTYGRVTLRCQKTKWGSCTAQGNLSFNVLLMLAPPEVLDYVVVHELCHRLEMNHSPRFWALVEKHDPDYRAHRRWLKEHGDELLARAGKV